MPHTKDLINTLHHKNPQIDLTQKQQYESQSLKHLLPNSIKINFFLQKKKN